MTRFKEMTRVHCREREEKIMIRKNDLRDLIYEEDGIGVVEIILILVVLIMLVVIFRKQITGIVSSAFSNINEDSEMINEDIELDEKEKINSTGKHNGIYDLYLYDYIKSHTCYI